MTAFPQQLRLGAELGLARLGVRWLPALVVAHLAVLGAALLERRSDLGAAADHVLTGATFGLVVPLLAYAWLRRVCAGARLGDSVQELGRFGASRRSLALGVMLANLPLLALAAASLGVVAGLATGANWGAGVQEALTSAWIGLLAGAAYTSWFALGSTFGSRGGGRGWFLILDWLLGPSAVAIALPLPRAHVQNLLGGSPVLDLPQWAASLALALLTLLFGGLALLRVPR